MVSRRSLLVFVFTVTLTGILNNTIVTPAVPDILAEFGQPSARSGWLIATGSLAGIVVAPIVGVLADRFGRRVVLTSCLVIFGVAGTSAALAPTFAVLLVARVLQGVGSAGLINLAVVLLGDTFTGRERTHWVGRNAAVLTVGLAAMPSVGGWVTDLAGWRVAFGLYTLALVTAVYAWVLLDDRRPADPPTVRAQLGGALQVVRRPTVAAVLAVGLLLFMAMFGGFLTVMPVHLDAEFGLDAGLRGLVLSAPALASATVAFNLVRLHARMSLRTLVVLAGSLFTVAFVVFGVAPNVWVVVVGTLLYGSGEGMLISSMQDAAMEEAPDAQRGAVVAVWVGAARLGQTTGPLLMSVVLDRVTTNVALAAGGLFTAAILALGVFGPFARIRASSPSEPAT